MRKITAIIATIILFSISSNAQFGVDIGVGATVDKPTFAAELNISYNIPLLNVSAGYTTALSRSVKDGALFNARIGKQFWLNDTYYLNPTIGYGYLLRSVDQKSLNKDYPVFGLGIYRQTRFEQTQLYLAGTTTGKTTFITVGIRGLII